LIHGGRQGITLALLFLKDFRLVYRLVSDLSIVEVAQHRFAINSSKGGLLLACGTGCLNLDWGIDLHGLVVAMYDVVVGCTSGEHVNLVTQPDIVSLRFFPNVVVSLEE
jgi:hypothetical protein